MKKLILNLSKDQNELEWLLVLIFYASIDAFVGNPRSYDRICTMFLDEMQIVLLYY
jgi:hypothetical protein